MKDVSLVKHTFIHTFIVYQNISCTKISFRSLCLLQLDRHPDENTRKDNREVSHRRDELF